MVVVPEYECMIEVRFVWFDFFGGTCFEVREWMLCFECCELRCVGIYVEVCECVCFGGGGEVLDVVFFFVVEVEDFVVECFE